MANTRSKKLTNPSQSGGNTQYRHCTVKKFSSNMKFFDSLLSATFLASSLVQCILTAEPGALIETRAPTPKWHATLTGEVYIKDDEVFGNESDRSPIPASTVTVTEFNPSKSFPVFKKCVGSEVRAGLHAFAELDFWTNPAVPRIRVRGHMKLYEGARCNTGDLDAGDLDVQYNISGYTIKVGQTKGKYVLLSTGGGDVVDFSLKTKFWEEDLVTVNSLLFKVGELEV